jgi:hypothetical protein
MKYKYRIYHNTVPIQGYPTVEIFCTHCGHHIESCLVCQSSKKLSGQALEDHVANLCDTLNNKEKSGIDICNCELVSKNANNASETINVDISASSRVCDLQSWFAKASGQTLLPEQAAILWDWISHNFAFNSDQLPEMLSRLRVLDKKEFIDFKSNPRHCLDFSDETDFLIVAI